MTRTAFLRCATSGLLIGAAGAAENKERFVLEVRRLV